MRRPVDRVMPNASFEDGYRDGWAGVAGTAPLPDKPTRPPPGDPDDYEAGFEYGRADALERGQTPSGDPKAPRV